MGQDKTYSILIVDDEGQVAMIMAKYLSFHKGFKNVVIAKDGVQAMHKLSNQEFDLIITDLVMPKRDGFTLIDHLRKIPKYYKTKIMIVSGCLNRELCIQAMRKGIRHILVKPFTARQILEKTFEILKVGKHPKKEVNLILQKVARKVAVELGDDSDSLTEKEIEELIDAYKASKET